MKWEKKHAWPIPMEMNFNIFNSELRGIHAINTQCACRLDSTELNCEP